MSTTNKNQIVAEMGKRFADAWNSAAIDAQIVTPSTPAPPWLKDVPELASPEIEQIEASIRAGKLTEAQAKPLLLQAGLRAAGKRLAAQGGQAPGMPGVPR